MDSATSAATLKEEGNRAFVVKDYDTALLKYDEALRSMGMINLSDADRKLQAVIHTNKSACNAFLKKYPEAASDAKKGTDIDPMFPKAWARLATAQQAMYLPVDAIASWQRALALLAKEKLSPSELTQKKQYTESLRKLTTDGLPSIVPEPDDRAPISQFRIEDAPWTRALAMVMPLYDAGDITSSAWAIKEAYACWVEGEKCMKTIRKMTGQGGLVTYAGSTGALMYFTNAVLDDCRIFHIDSSEWFAKSDLNAHFEESQTRAPSASESIPTITGHIKRLFLEGGFKLARPAFGTVVRKFVMLAFTRATVMNDHIKSTGLLDKALDILTWGQQEWATASRDERGSVLEDTWIRGVRTMRLEHFVQAFRTTEGVDARFTLYGLQCLAQAALDEVEAAQDSLPEVMKMGPGFTNAFYRYPKAVALKTQGFVFNQLAQECPREEKEKILNLFSQSGRKYLEASNIYPKDDEYHCYWKCVAMISLCRSHAKLSETLPLIPEIRESIIASKQIWDREITMIRQAEGFMEDFEEIEAEVRPKLEAGTLTMDDRYWLEGYEYDDLGQKIC